MSSRLMKNGIRFLLQIGIVLLLAVSWVLAQDDAGRVLTPGVASSGRLDSDNVAQVYTFAGSTGQTVSLSATGGDGALLAILLTDALGAAVAQVMGDEDGATIADIELPTDGTYFVTVLSADGLADTAKNFTLTLETDAASAPAPFTEPGELLTATGIQIALQWGSTANLDLEIRDPLGGSLRFATPSVASGGTFGVNVNSVCNALNDSNPTEEATWVAGVVPTGSYEILVYYQPLDDCPTTDPVDFGVNVTVDGTAIPAFQGMLQPNQIYIASFVVNADGTVDPGLSGIRIDPPSITNVPLDNPTPLTRDTAVSGFITSAQPFQVYSFAGQANEVVSLLMEANSGNLDTLLIVVDPNGNIVSVNDDTAQGITNSTITNLSLILAGEYTVLATRYGEAIGGTQGGYTLTLTGALTGADTQTTTTALPDLPNLPQGSVQVSLQWSTAADLRLLIRDPQGDTVFVDQPQIPSGGQLVEDGNVNCTATSTSPVSYIYWPAGRLPNAGPYEIEVQHRSQCNDTTPVTFNLNVVANGQSVLSVTQPVFREGERYVTSFTIDTNGQIIAGQGGIFGTVQRPDSATLDFAAQIETAQVLTSNQSLNGSIRLNKKFDLYVFDGQADQMATIGMQARNGTLDTVLFLIDPSGVQIAQNDDASAETTDSLINEFTLPVDGRYIIIATHFGGLYGVTAGDYNLTLRLN